MKAIQMYLSTAILYVIMKVACAKNLVKGLNIIWRGNLLTEFHPVPCKTLLRLSGRHCNEIQVTGASQSILGIKCNKQAIVCTARIIDGRDWKGTLGENYVDSGR